MAHHKKIEAMGFWSFLESCGEIKDGHTKQSLRNIYYGEYKEYARSQNPDNQALSFSGIMFMLKRSHFLEHKNDEIKFKISAVNATESRWKKQHSGILKNESGKTENESGVQRKSRKRTKKIGRVAVDQHVTIKGNLEELLNSLTLEDSTEEAACAEEEVKLPPCVKLARGKFECQICEAKSMPSTTELRNHLQGRRHRTNVLIYSLKKERDMLIKDKESIEVTTEMDGDHGNILLETKENGVVSVEMMIENTSDEEQLILKHCEMLKKIRVFKLSDKKKITEGRSHITIAPGGSYMITVTFRARHIGRYNTPVALTFSRPNNPSSTIHIVRYLVARCYNRMLDELGPSVPYKRPPRVAISRQKMDIIPGEPLPSEGVDGLEREVALEPHLIPGSLRRLINHGLHDATSLSVSDRENLARIKSLLSSQLSAGNLRSKCEALLHVEEIQMEVDIRKYDVENATLKTCKQQPKLLTLEVPGLAEKRPSVLRGDHLYVRRRKADGTAENKEYQGFVHVVTQTEVWLGFSKKLLEQHVSGMKYAVRFTFNRLPCKLQHRAVLLAEEHSLDQVLFPTAGSVGSVGCILPLDAPLFLYDQQLESNPEQMSAVRHIVAGTSRPAPYLVFGPPGTGKTVTIVESIKQVIRCIPAAHILACAPSNSAADLLTERLLKHVQKNAILRLHAISRSWNEVPEEVKEVSNYRKGGSGSSQYYFPNKENLLQYKVLICTLVTAGRIASANFPPAHFSHVFIDEAGHAVEPEAIIAIAGILESDIAHRDGGQVVLAGDPEQLGPILRSPIALKYGLSVSLLERLMSHCDLYKRQPGAESHDLAYDNRVLTKLIKNYRSHPSILKLPNECFYERELQAYGDIVLTTSLCSWEQLPRKQFPLLFHGIVGKDEREERSPSFFNPEEVVVVMKYVDDLLSSKVKVLAKEIGIITPYRKQVQKIQKMLRQKLLNDVKVGSVEEFQGQERRVIIISTVRSHSEYLAMDYEFKLGFLKNPKRFNVAVTRAKALLIIVGNPYTLARDEHWNMMLEYCRANGGYTGCDYEDQEDQMEDVLQRFHAVSLDASDEEEGIPISEVQQQEDPEWRAEQ